MPIELEAKMKVADLAAVRSRLAELHAPLLRKIDELNTFLDTPDHNLLKSDEGLRIRRNLNVQTNEETIVITFKGPRAQGPYKSREELELTVDSYDDALALFTRLGYQPCITFEKHREIYTLENCEICLDSVAQLGDFVEIEGPDETSITRVRDKLNLQSAPPIKESYAALIATHRERRG